jgi:SAM-dependent methyltransferase
MIILNQMNFKKKFTIEKNIYFFEIKKDVTKKVADFYNSKPFPNYKNLDDKSSILNLGNNNFIARKFKEFIGFDKEILEVGTGTGQLSNYLAIGTNNRIFALDPTIKSIELGSDFALKNNIPNVSFINGDIFDDIFANSAFDHIWCSGVLHHTKKPYKAFQILIKSLKTNGYVVLGLYNKFGRFRTFVRQFFFKFFGYSFVKFFDPILRNDVITDKDKIESWVNDQYRHPVESSHTIDEVLSWFKDNNIDFINSIPECDFHTNPDIFKKKSKGNFVGRIIRQVFMIFTPVGADGGLFIMIGKKIK